MLISNLMGTISAKHGFSEMKPCPSYQHLNVHTFSTVVPTDLLKRSKYSDNVLFHRIIYFRILDNDDFIISVSHYFLIKELHI